MYDNPSYNEASRDPAPVEGVVYEQPMTSPPETELRPHEQAGEETYHKVINPLYLETSPSPLQQDPYYATPSFTTPHSNAQMMNTYQAPRTAVPAAENTMSPSSYANVFHKTHTIGKNISNK